MKLLALGVVLAGVVSHEIRTSSLQSRFFHWYGARLSYTVEQGPSNKIVLPKGGPLNERRGYSRLKEFQKQLETQGFQVTEQARFSPELMQLAEWGVTPPFRQPPVRGLRIRGADGSLLYDATTTSRFFLSFDEIPPLIVRTLLFIENRELQEPVNPYRNPVVEWDRLAKAAFLYAGSRLGLPVSLEGGSTLAIQLEKYQHSPGGRTDSASDKLRQITAASFKAYRDGRETSPRTKEIILDYLNTMPLAATPHYGEILGLGNGLYAWFNRDLADVSDALVSPATSGEDGLHAYKQVLTLLLATRAPTHYLARHPASLEERLNQYIELLTEAGIIEPKFADGLTSTSVVISPHAPLSPPLPIVYRKPSNAIRYQLSNQLAVRDFYELDRLDLEVGTAAIDPGLQSEVIHLFQKLSHAENLAAFGLRQDRILLHGDPSKVLYSMLLFEKTPEGNKLRVHADNLNQPFDLNTGIKLELGSSAKLRTLAHYLELVASLHDEFSSLGPEAPAMASRRATDPITRWAIQTFASENGIGLEAFLEKALDRTYSASPAEAFFTGGGRHTFRNFDSNESHLTLTVRQAMRLSTNLVFIRLMRDLVRYHQARLPYDPEAVMSQTDHPERRRLLEEIAEAEGRQTLYEAYRAFRGVPSGRIVAHLLGTKAMSRRHLAMLFYAWQIGSEKELGAWLEELAGPTSEEEVRWLARAYNNPVLNISDFGYLLGRHPLRVWAAGEVFHNPEISWERLLSRSVEAQRVASAWLLQTRNRRAQDLRLLIRIEQDAFARMTPYWQRLGFPFEELVPSLATAIGSSSDRPIALAELMGIIVNNGIRKPTRVIQQLRFAQDTSYHTVLEPSPISGERVMQEPVARALRKVLAEVVEGGTARRLAGAFTEPGGSPIVVGGKTGSGDNRFKTFGSSGKQISSHAVNRTATFVFYIGDRYFGIVTAFVEGREAGAYRFTSALPLSIVRLLAPVLVNNGSHDVEEPQSGFENVLAAGGSENSTVETLATFEQRSEGV